jgi:catechol 2,3-dioxygenase-like lactoylglutathione lyase family enzyme
MSITSLCPTLMVEDVAHSVTFYLDVLGFSFVWGLAEDTRTAIHDWPSPAPLAMALVRNGQAQLSLQTRSFMASTLPLLANASIGGSFLLFMDCEDLDALYERISERVPFLKAPHVNAHGSRQCSIEDPDGYILTFAQRTLPPTPTMETVS